MEFYEELEENEGHQELIDQVLATMPSEDEFADLALLFKMFADETRCKILKALSVKELCVGELCLILQLSQSAVSHQLASLKKTRLVRSRKQGKTVYYSLNDQHIFDLFQIAYEHISE